MDTELKQLMSHHLDDAEPAFDAWFAQLDKDIINVATEYEVAKVMSVAAFRAGWNARAEYEKQKA